MTDGSHALRRLGRYVAEYRIRLGVQQNQIPTLQSKRTEVAHLEEGRELPSANILEQICTALKMPRHLWYAATHDRYIDAMRFEAILCELVGKPVSIEPLDDMSGHLCVDAIAHLLTDRASEHQSLSLFNSILTFYGERSVNPQFFTHFLGPGAFETLDTFEAKVIDFQKMAIRLYGSFRQAYQTLRICEHVSEALVPVQKIGEEKYTQRRPFDSIRLIESERLDDLGYISAERVKRESRDRLELSQKLNDLARKIREVEPDVLNAIPEPKRLRRIQTLLRRFGSHLVIETNLFSPLDPDDIESEAKRIAPADADLARIEQTQDLGRRNLSAYLTEPYMDVYVATSMRERADFVSVNAFVETLFHSPDLKHMNLRYFNPTQSWIEDRVAKGLVEALMLRRSQLTVYMAQKTDTFGKDSEASVALGQGKPVIVYVPKLVDDIAKIDSESLMMRDQQSLEVIAREHAVEPEEGVDKQSLVSTLLLTQLVRLQASDFERVVKSHWADFDLYGELVNLEPTTREKARSYLDRIVHGSDKRLLEDDSKSARGALTERLVAVSLRFESRATTFREIHPLALQVILSSGVLNGILVVRSAGQCSKIMHRLLTNNLDSELVVDSENYKLVERITKSTLRVISRNQILTNAFWTQYFPQI